mgnify:CR=1 FL=1
MKVTVEMVPGRGVVSEQQQNEWLLPLPVCDTVNESIHKLSNCSFFTSIRTSPQSK